MSESKDNKLINKLQAQLDAAQAEIVRLTDEVQSYHTASFECCELRVKAEEALAASQRRAARYEQALWEILAWAVGDADKEKCVQALATIHTLALEAVPQQPDADGGGEPPIEEGT